MSEPNHSNFSPYDNTVTSQEKNKTCQNSQHITTAVV